MRVSDVACSQDNDSSYCIQAQIVLLLDLVKETFGQDFHLNIFPIPQTRANTSSSGLLKKKKLFEEPL